MFSGVEVSSQLARSLSPSDFFITFFTGYVPGGTGCLRCQRITVLDLGIFPPGRITRPVYHTPGQLSRSFPVRIQTGEVNLNVSTSEHCNSTADQERVPPHLSASERKPDKRCTHVKIVSNFHTANHLGPSPLHAGTFRETPHCVGLRSQPTELQLQ